MALDGTYAGLQASVADWLMRDDLAAATKDFIRLAENRTARTLRVAEMEQTATLSLVDGVAVLPADFLEVRQVLGGSSPQRPLAMLPPIYANDRYAGSVAGLSSGYTIANGSLVTFPAGTGFVGLTYYAKPTPLSDANPSNWLLVKAPEVYLYGALIESAPFLSDDTRLQVWGTMYNQALDNLQSADTRGRYAGAVVRVRGATP